MSQAGCRRAPLKKTGGLQLRGVSFQVKGISVYVKGSLTYVRTIDGNGHETQHRTIILKSEDIDNLTSLLQKAKILAVQQIQTDEPGWLKNQREKIPWIAKTELEVRQRNEW